MFKLELSPSGTRDRISVSADGDALHINGEAFDFSGLPDGANISHGNIPCHWIVGDVRRTDGVVIVPLLLPHGANAPEETRFPSPVFVSEGPAVLPPYGDDPVSPPESMAPPVGMAQEWIDEGPDDPPRPEPHVFEEEEEEAIEEEEEEAIADVEG